MSQQLLVASLIVQALFFAFLLLTGSLVWWRYGTQKKWLASYVGGVLILFTLAAGHAIKKYEDGIQRYSVEIERLRSQYPVESLELRLPLPPVHATVSRDLSTTARKALMELEGSIDSTDGRDREERLQKLHEGSVAEFVRREGFGVARMLGGYAESVLANYGRGKTSIPQARGDLPHDWKQRHSGMPATEVSSFPFLSAHSDNVLHFVNPTGFGLVKGRNYIAGFQAHQFNELKEPFRWKIQRLELLGLLLAEEPRVYVTDDLPRMEQIRAASTRALDEFETAGLANIQRGEELFICEGPAGIRMLGALRSAKQCLKCHGGERGDLLGAFSYFLEKR